jgi:hypothetical protein
MFRHCTRSKVTVGTALDLDLKLRSYCFIFLYFFYHLSVVQTDGSTRLIRSLWCSAGSILKRLGKLSVAVDR